MPDKQNNVLRQSYREMLALAPVPMTFEEVLALRIGDTFYEKQIGHNFYTVKATSNPKVSLLPSGAQYVEFTGHTHLEKTAYCGGETDYAVRSDMSTDFYKLPPGVDQLHATFGGVVSSIK